MWETQWKIQWNFEYFLWFLKECSAYFAIQLGRCTLLSLACLGVVLVLRKTVLKNRIFAKGMIWSIFLPVPFMGKLNLFYENTLAGRLFMWWNNGCIMYPAVRYGYMLGILVSGFLFLRQRCKTHKGIACMETTWLYGSKVYLNEAPATPYTTGIFRTKIVIPRVIADGLEEEDIRIILLHERIHNQLGHLLFYLIWDMLRMLLWPNYLLTCCMRYFREDMEDICDHVTIKRSGRAAYEYGQVLLRSIKLLKTHNKEVLAALVGENDYQDIKRRFTNVAAYRPYGKSGTILLCTSCLAFLLAMSILLKENSFPKYVEEMDAGLIDETGEYYYLPEGDALERAYYTDGQYIYLDREAFQNVLQENGIDEDMDSFWLGFGGYTKLPGIGGNINMVYVNYDDVETKLMIPYNNREDYFWEYVYKYIL